MSESPLLLWRSGERDRAEAHIPASTVVMGRPNSDIHCQEVIDEEVLKSAFGCKTALIVGPNRALA
jgi:hypothetical protein